MWLAKEFAIFYLAVIYSITYLNTSVDLANCGKNLCRGKIN